MYWISRELEIGHLGAVPTGVFAAPLQRRELTQAGLEDESFLLALPQEIFVFLGERTQVLIFIGVLVDDVLWVVLDSFAVSKETGPHGGPAGMKNFLLRHVSA